MLFTPDTDGYNHINIWSRGRTELGQLLSNFAHTPFVHFRFGHFQSMEGYWYWIKTGMQHDALKNLMGFSAKKVGRMLPSVTTNDFADFIRQGIECKILQNYLIADMLVKSTLPLTHYFAYGQANDWRLNIPSSGHFQVEFIEELRYQLKVQRL